MTKAVIFANRMLVMVLLVLAAGCGSQNYYAGRQEQAALQTVRPPRTGYSIQVGAFSDVDHAMRLSRSLAASGIEAYYFRHRSGYYKVRFGDFPTHETARQHAEEVKAAGLIEDYLIVRPERRAETKQGSAGEDGLRSMIVSTAETFIGVPYKWGGQTAEEGFDCSGLVVAVYRLNGLRLPRTSRAQYRTGQPVRKERLRKGDLVFFATNGGRRVTHVGIYAGGGEFIHAPKRGGRIERTPLTNEYFRVRYVGARTYLQPGG